jgi:hypothetical protein
MNEFRFTSKEIITEIRKYLKYCSGNSNLKFNTASTKAGNDPQPVSPTLHPHNKSPLYYTSNFFLV